MISMKSAHKSAALKIQVQGGLNLLTNSQKCMRKRSHNEKYSIPVLEVSLYSYFYLCYCRNQISRLWNTGSQGVLIKEGVESKLNDHKDYYLAVRAVSHSLQDARGKINKNQRMKNFLF